MASSDMTALMPQMIKQVPEQQHAAQEMIQEHRRAADEHQRQFMAAIMDRRADQTPAGVRSTIEKSSDQDRLQGVLWGTRGLDNVVQGPPGSTIVARMRRCAYGNRGRRNEGIPRRFRSRSVDPDQLHKAQQAWVSLVISCKGVAFDIVNAEKSASEAWAKLVQHYQASGLK